MMKFLHTAAGFPMKETWYKAVKASNYVTWPGLMPEAVNKHFPESDETTLGHMKKQCQGVRSTSIHGTKTNSAEPTDQEKKKDIYTKIHNASETTHTDQMGRFPATSTSRNQYKWY